MTINVETTPVLPNPPLVSSSAPGSFLVNLLIYNGHPFRDHWAYFVQSSKDKNLGVKIHATGSVRDGFVFEVKRRHDMRHNEDVPAKIVPLQWVDGELFDESAMLGDSDSEETLDYRPVCKFERELYKVSVPGKSLVGIQDTPREDAGRRKITQRDCQTWIVEAADQLVGDGIFRRDVADYLRAIQQ
ncbi:hypothetical protein BDW62DRAFT_195328 [Aspergillus aurantiobrunneus]